MRLLRIANLIRSEVSDVLLKKMNDARIGFISITRVELTPDLKYAKIYYSQFGSDSDKKKTLKALNRAKGFIKYEVGKVLNFKTMPDFEFKFDESVEKAFDVINRIDAIENNE